jgi:uncharacterized surface protein with fasciclin (FAS1) repeats
MKTMKLRFLALIAFISFGFTSCDNDDDAVVVEDNSITGIASRNSNLTSLVAALNRAGLAGTLQSGGPYTVFAPTNAAFSTFLSANGFANLEAVPIPALKEILLNHVVNGATQSTGLTNNMYLKTLGKGSASAINTLSMHVNTTSGVKLNGVSNVTTPNVIASNGVIHIVDAVIALPTVVTHAVANSSFSTLATLLTNQGLVPTLQGTASSPFTVFAPNNAAFTTFETQNPGTLASLTSAQVTSVLKYHVVAGANVLSTGIPTTPITTFETGTFTIAGTVITDEANRNTNIIATDVQCSNGVIHVVNNVLLPTL